ncbi:hypothetical protein ACWD3J_14185 [Streptomyces sp. NPDC002755]
MIKDPYTDDDLRAEAARQLSDAINPDDLLPIGERMEGRKILSRGDFQWDQLDDIDFENAEREVGELVEDAVDLCRWSVDLGAFVLTKTTELGWGRGVGWDLAVQIAHRRGLDDELHDALVAAIRGAVSGVLAERGITDVHPTALASAEGTQI